MKNQPSKKAGAFLQTENRDARALFEKIKLITELNSTIKPLLDENIRDYCQVGNLIGDKLILIAANGSIATEVRFQSVDLLRKFKQQPALPTIQTIHCKVRPATSSSRPSSPKPTKMAPLSSATANIVQDIARSLKDPALREVMERIAKHK